MLEVRTFITLIYYELLLTSCSFLAYTTYAFFEWSLVLLDVAFDACTMFDFEGFEITLTDVKGVTRGYVPWLPK